MDSLIDGRTCTFKYDWGELSALYKKLTSDSKAIAAVKSRKLRSKIGTTGNNGEWSREGFHGATSNDINERLRNGYRFSHHIDPNNLPVVSYDRPRMRYTDDPEGEFDNDLYNSGETEYFLTKPKRRSVGGIRLNVQYNFSAAMKAEIIGDYAKWIGAVIEALQARGYDLEINVFGLATHTYHNKGECAFYVRVSKFNERVMPHDWSALFSPGGYRHLMFLAKMWPEEIHPELTCKTGLGKPKGLGWDVKWDSKDREIKITVNNMANTFPIDEMTKKFENWKDQ